MKMWEGRKQMCTYFNLFTHTHTLTHTHTHSHIHTHTHTHTHTRTHTHTHVHIHIHTKTIVGLAFRPFLHTVFEIIYSIQRPWASSYLLISHNPWYISAAAKELKLKEIQVCSSWAYTLHSIQCSWSFHLMPHSYWVRMPHSLALSRLLMEQWCNGFWMTSPCLQWRTPQSVGVATILIVQLLLCHNLHYLETLLSSTLNWQ